MSMTHVQSKTMLMSTIHAGVKNQVGVHDPVSSSYGQVGRKVSFAVVSMIADV